MEDIFCRIIKGEIPSTKIYEDDDVLAILDISQTTKGHTLVIPKLHCDNFLSCPQEVMHKVMDVAQRIGQAEISLLHARGVNILTNVNEAAGQSVMHFNVHVIPRYNGGEGFQITMKGQDTSGMDLPRLAMDISKAMKKE
jgi:histidine triad (HIT) family protein